jgi:protein-tyrosine phosphatase
MVAMSFTDIHCHLLPGIDDGAKSWDDSLTMARLAVEQGIGTIICTPHQCGTFSHNTADAIRSLLDEARRKLAEHEIPLTLLPGADVRIETGLVSALKNGEVLSLGDHRRHVLLELPHEVYLPLERLIEELRSARMVGILSHPERNAGILARPELVNSLVEAGCLMQVTAGSLMGAFGPQSQQAAERFVSAGLVHFLATDAHGPKSRRPLVRQAFERAAQLVGEAAASAMCDTNPAAVADGNDVPLGYLPVAAAKTTTRFANWFGRKQPA